MTPHENALILIKEFEYNAREVGEVLKVSTKMAEKKIKSEGYHKFTNEQFTKLLFHFQQKIENHTKVLEKIKDLD